MVDTLVCKQSTVAALFSPRSLLRVFILMTDARTASCLDTGQVLLHTSVPLGYDSGGCLQHIWRHSHARHCLFEWLLPVLELLPEFKLIR